jgi:hypothetical protein
MNYHELVQAYFERSRALSWYWTVYIAVIGGILAFSLFRFQKDLPRTILITLLYAGFAWKNLGAIEATTLEREAFLSAMKDYRPAQSEAVDVKRVRERLEPTLQPSSVADVRYFHLACDLLTIVALWVREWRRPNSASTISAAQLGRPSA